MPGQNRIDRSAGAGAPDERAEVLRIIMDNETNGTFSHVLVREALDRRTDLPPARRAFIKRLAEGTIERKLELDAIISEHLKDPGMKLRPVIRCILRMGVYQILYMDSVPASAACSEAVLLTKKRKMAQLSGFVNGILRSIARDAEAGRYAASISGTEDAPALEPAAESAHTGRANVATSEDEAKNPTERLSLRYSMPEAITSLWMEQYGEEQTEKLLASLLEIRPVTIRMRPDSEEEERRALAESLEKAGVRVERGLYLPYAFRLFGAGNLRDLPGYSDGQWTVQDESSMLAVEAAGIPALSRSSSLNKSALRIVDVCAAPGGKSLLAAQLLSAEPAVDQEDTFSANSNSNNSANEPTASAGEVFSYDLTSKKTARIHENAERLGVKNIHIAEKDALVFDPELTESAEVLLCDLPCSGLGVIGKKRDIKYRVTANDMEQLADLQRQILTNVVRYLKPGGVLIYSTCTIDPAENEDNAKFIEEQLGLTPDDLRPYLPSDVFASGEASDREVHEGEVPDKEAREEEKITELQLLPHIHGTDGFFISRFIKRDE